MDTTIQLIQGWFPGLRGDEAFKITSPCTEKYNCIAWAASMDSCNLWPYQNNGLPAEPDGKFIQWPKDIAKDFSVKSFRQLFETYGYELCDAAPDDSRYEYVAVFADANGEVTHAARQLPDGSWTSKLGPLNDVRHSLRALEGDLYGTVHCIMRRRK